MKAGLIGEIAFAISRAAVVLGDERALVTWVAFLGEVLAQDEVAAQELMVLKEHINQMVAAGRGPTEEDWAELKAKSDEAHAIIANWSPDDGDDDSADGGA